MSACADSGAPRFWSPPAAPADICFRPRRWPRRLPSAASRSILRPMSAPRAYGGAFAGDSVHVIPSATVRGAQSVALARTRLTASRSASARRWSLMRRLRPAAVVGFGGYPTIPPVLAAAWRGVPTHHARAERGDGPRQSLSGAARDARSPRLSRHVRATSRQLAAKATLTGNPVRPAVLGGRDVPYPAPMQPARCASSSSAAARARASWPTSCRPRSSARPGLQCAPRDRAAGARGRLAAACSDVYARLAVAAEIAPFFSDLPARMAASHLVIVALGRLDRRRTRRDRPAGDPGAAAARARPGSTRQCRRCLQAPAARCGSPGRFHPGAAGRRNRRACGGAAALAAMAAAAQVVGALDAAERLADLVLRVAGIAILVLAASLVDLFRPECLTLIG